MPDGSYPFPMYSGLLEPEHYKKIGSAIWLFLWCVSSTTFEKEEEGTVWGIVLGNKPMKLSDISERFGVNDKTVSRWLDTLEDHHYIRVTRAPRGLILSVRNSKKWADKNVRSDKTELSDHKESEQTKMSDQSVSDKTKMSDLKDIIKDLTATTTADDIEPDEQAEGSMIQILNAYCKLHNKFDIHVSANEREAMGKMVAGGTPNPFTIRTMESLLEAKRIREGANFKLPKSFLYYVEGIQEAWQNHLATLNKPDRTKPAHMPPEQPKRMTKQQRELEELRRRAKEEREREQSRGY
ncbi:MarR family transcriptional regulator [Paenibacillus sp. VMFN-D1]|uniref:MarR family transcriptional regulator n=1 Tax=Paenibacillus sp. VMFN-D1 TaxID=2135608 RepID=UPI000E394B45|nr:MarR family transcriptional regulator [Paenibacillus sp. VMFN-D1]RED34698.1 MarR family protein [Paenibacillus sp. VMFN-D1]